MTDRKLVELAQRMVSSKVSRGKPLAELVSECLKVLEECNGRQIQFRNLNKCRNLLAQTRSECIAVYSYIYENYCKGRADYGLIRSEIGDILGTERDVLKVLYEIDKFIRKHCAGDPRS